LSFRVRIIPEDPTYNGEILRPLVVRMMTECGKPRARVTVLTNPKAEGYENAKRLIECEVLDLYSHIDLLLFLPDADGKDRTGEFKRLESLAARKEVTLFCCAAKEEVEAWLLAGHTRKLRSSWSKVRADVHVKENVFEQLLRKHGNAQAAGGGREALMRQTLSNYGGLLKRCPELKDLHERIQAHLKSVEAS